MKSVGREAALKSLQGVTPVSVWAVQSVPFAPPLITDERKEEVGVSSCLCLQLLLRSVLTWREVPSWTARCFSNMLMHKHTHTHPRVEQIFILKGKTGASCIADPFLSRIHFQPQNERRLVSPRSGTFNSKRAFFAEQGRRNPT